MRDAPSVSVVIRTRNSATEVGRALQAVRAQRHPSFEVILVDSQSTDGTVDIGTKYGARIVSLAPEEFTYGYALNLGCAASRANLVALLSSDATPATAGWLEALVAPFADPSVAGSYGRQLPYPGCDPITARDLATRYDDRPRRQVIAPFLSAANAAIRRSVWEGCRFDETSPGAEDAEWAGRVQQLGYVLTYEPEAAVHHCHFESFRQTYRRFHRESAGIPAVLPGPPTSLVGCLRDWQARTREDWRYLLETGAARRWFYWVPVYRLCRSLGIHRGAWHRPRVRP